MGIEFDRPRKLRHYIMDNDLLRGDEIQLFVSNIKPHKTVKPCTVANWLKGLRKWQEWIS